MISKAVKMRSDLFPDITSPFQRNMNYTRDLPAARPSSRTVSTNDPQFRNATRVWMTWLVASSISQCPEFGTVTARELLATSFICSPSN